MKRKIIILFLIAVIGVAAVYLIFPRPRNDGVIIEEVSKKEAEVNDIKKEENKEPVELEEVKEVQPAEEKIEEQENLTEEKKEQIPLDKLVAGKTAEEAWKTLILAWKNDITASDLEIYTDMTKFIRKDYKEIPEYFDEPYKILQKGSYAVVYFEKNKYPPFLLCKTRDGWKYDEVTQRKIIRKNDEFWGIERYISPYSPILRNFPVFLNLDMPIESQDIYKISNDKELAKNIADIEKLYFRGKLTYEKAIQLGRLYYISTLDLKAIYILEKAKEKMPENPDLYKYLAIAYVNSSYNYEAAFKEMEKYVELSPESEYGHNFLGYLFLKMDKPTEAEAEFKKALEINPKTCYAHAKLTRIYKEANNLQDYQKMFQKTKEFCRNDEYERFIWLIQWLHKGNK